MKSEQVTIYQHNKTTSNNNSKASIAYMFNDASVVNIPIRKDEEGMSLNSSNSSEKIRNMLNQVSKQTSSPYTKNYKNY